MSKKTIFETVYRILEISSHRLKEYRMDMCGITIGILAAELCLERSQFMSACLGIGYYLYKRIA